MNAQQQNPLLVVEDLVVEYPTRGWRSRPFRAVKGVGFDIRPAETLGLIGESGSGKSTIGRALLGLAPVAGGRILFDGEDVSRPTHRRRRELTGQIQVVYQDPYSSLNPAMTIGDILTEPMTVRRTPRRQALERVRELLETVGLPADAVRRLPREFSGGQRQRIAIARALVLRPRLVVCDEPVSALDLSTQQRVLDLFVDIQERTGVAYLFVSHDLTVVRELAHRVAVMYRGEIVEQGDGDTVTSRPSHPYTQRLLLSSPVCDPAAQEERRAERRRLTARP
ncbi:ATP-binding cassette domain-containing protein [Nocardiopsis aegyptia]|uniref:ATP-binding cassette domain-containing protein n=1 Tax=Nocardiopsis aegyptia TaxID=220378 RepID=UPI00366D0381